LEKSVSTASTKSRARKGGQAKQTTGTRGKPDAPPPTEHTRDATELSARTWQIASGAILLVAALLRVYHLALNPLHHDEGVNGFFLTNLMRQGVYHYDPANYHGPTLYYFALPLTYPLDQWHHLDTWALRAVTAAFGVGVVWLVLCLRRYLGAFGALAAAALLAVSPGMVYNSRYFIHEMLFVFFTLGIVVAALRFYEGEAQPARAGTSGAHRSPEHALVAHRMGFVGLVASIVLVAATLSAVYRPANFTVAIAIALAALCGTIWAAWAYDGPRASYLLLGAAAAGLLFATKETAFISAGTLVLAALIGWFWVWFMKLLRPHTARQGKKGRAQVAVQSAWRGFVERSGGYTHILLLLCIALGIFLFVNIIYYSSFFTNAKGVKDALETFDIWKKTGESEFHHHPFTTYLGWLWQEEAPLLLLGTLGTIIAVWRGRNRFAVFAGAWAFGITLAYSLINYKTPWLQLNFILPLALVGGYALELSYRYAVRRAQAPVVALALLACALGIALYQTYQINFIHYDDDRYPYVYAHTTRGYLELIAKIDELSRRAGTGTDTHVNIASPDYWPMPWYLRDYKNVGYLGRLAPTDDDLVIINVNQQAEADSVLREDYHAVGTYPLRPGVTLVLYARNDLGS
jgi:uncharacterized protein (TIGR03663 family)